MTESEVHHLVQQHLVAFADPRAVEAVKQWTLLMEPAPECWLLYRPDDDLGIAYSLSTSWADTPWAVVDGFSNNSPSVRTYCPDLEDAVRDVVYDGNAPSGKADMDARAAMAEKALRKRRAKGN